MDVLYHCNKVIIWAWNSSPQKNIFQQKNMTYNFSVIILIGHG